MEDYAEQLQRVGSIYYGLMQWAQWRNAALLEDEIANVKLFTNTGQAAEAVGTYLPAIVAFELLVASIRDVDQKVRDDLRNDNFASGFSQGLIVGLLGWKWRQAVDVFGRKFVLHVYQRQELNEIRVLYYNVGLSLGYHHAATLTPEARQAYLKTVRKDSGAKAGDWDRNDQISYVIALAAAFRKEFMNF
jgi:hypothetical protein